MGLYVGSDEGSGQPGPDRTLVVGGVAVAERPFVAAPVAGVSRGEGAESVRREQVMLHSFKHLECLGARDQGVMKA